MAKVDLTDVEVTRTVVASLRADLIFHLCSYAQGERDLALVLPTFRGELVATINLLTSVAEISCRRLVMAGSLEETDLGEIFSIRCREISRQWLRQNVLPALWCSDCRDPDFHDLRARSVR
jgi:GDP-D-mannose dehydratase